MDYAPSISSTSALGLARRAAPGAIKHRWLDVNADPTHALRETATA